MARILFPFLAILLAATAQTTKDIKFEVLSLRPIQPGAALSLTTNPTLNGFVARLSVWQIIMLAYTTVDYQNWGSTELLNYPNWLGEFYDIDARVSQADLKAWQSQSRQHELLRTALRNALKDRCKLALHEQPAEAANWQLVVTKRGPRFKASAPGAALPVGQKLASGGVMVANPRGEKEVKSFYGATMEDLVWFLNILSRGVPVHDSTGLTGRYDFIIQEVEQLSADRDPLARFPVDQLGLQLKPGKESRPILVIDHIEKPTAN